MKKTFFKNLFRDIKNTPSRFLSIIIIIAVGVAFYSGVRATSPAMKTSADYYLDKNNFMDFKLISTLGITEEGMAKIQKQKGIAKAEGSHSLDAVIEEGDKQLVINVNSLPKKDGINDIRIVKGRRPKQENEIVVEESFMKEAKYKLNDTITLKSGNEDNLGDDLKETKFKIVGTATSPIYLSQQRQISSVGNGNVRGFIYLLPDVFKSEVYTEVYARTESKESKNSLLDNKVYNDHIKSIEKDLKDIGITINQNRYQDVLRGAKDKIEEAEKKLEDSRKEVKEEFANARKKIEDAQSELEKGNTELKENEKLFNKKMMDGKKELEDGRRAIELGEKKIVSGREAIKNGQVQIVNEKNKLNEGEKKLNAESLKLEAGRKKLEEADSKLDDGRKQIESGTKVINSKRQEIQNGRAQIEATKKKLDASETQLNEGKKQLVGQVASAISAEVDRAEQLMNSDPTNDIYITQYNAIRGLYENYISGKDFDSMYSSLKASGQLEMVNKYFDIEKLKSEFDKSYAQIISGRTQITNETNKLKEGEAKLNIEASKLEEIKRKMSLSEEELNKARREIELGEKEIKNGRAQIENGRAQIIKEENKLKQAEIDLDKAAIKIEDSKKKIAEGEISLEKGRQEGLRELEKGRKKLEDGQIKINENLEKLIIEEDKANKKLEDGQKKIEKNREKLDDIKEPDWYVLGRNQNLGYETYRQDSDRIDNIGKLFPLIFFLVAALVSLTTMTRMVQEKRTEIGTFKALGYSSFAIISHYLIYSLAASIIGSIFGVLIGFKLFPPLIIQAYASLYSVPDVLTSFMTSLALQSSLIAILFTSLAAGLAAFGELREVPASLMRPKPPKAGKKILLERIDFIWRRLKFTNKVTARNIFRFKQRLFMTVIGIAACTGLMITGFGLKDGIVGATETQFQEIYKYDMQGSLNKDKGENDKQIIKEKSLKDENIKSILFTNSKSGTVKSKGVRDEDVYVVAPEYKSELNNYIKLYFKDKELALKDDGVIITEKLSQLIDKKVGDTIKITIDDKTVNAKISNITQQYIQHYVYMSPVYYEKITGQTMTYNNFYGLLKDTSYDSQNKTSQNLKDINGINSISFKNNSKVDYDKSIDSVNSVVFILIASAGVLAFVVIYNLTNINITERRRELATIKLLGFYNKELAGYIYRENMVLTLLGSFVGIFIGILLNKFVLSTAETNVIKFLEKISPIHFLYSVLLTLLFSAIVNLAMYKRFEKIDMIESLKSAE